MNGAVLSAVAAVTQAEAERRVAALSLDMLHLKLADVEEGYGWSLREIRVYEREYRRFLILNLLYPAEAIVPCKEVDKFWHAHILDSAAYRVDCENLFGAYFDHFPYFGLRGPDDAAALHDAYDRTLELYVHHFGPPPEAVWRPESLMKCRRTSCKPMKCRRG